MRARTFSIDGTPTDLSVGAGSLWIGTSDRSPEFARTNFPGSVSRVDPESGAVDATIRLPRSGGQYFQGGGLSEQHVAATDDAVWAVNPDTTRHAHRPGDEPPGGEDPGREGVRRRRRAERRVGGRGQASAA